MASARPVFAIMIESLSPADRWSELIHQAPSCLRGVIVRMWFNLSDPQFPFLLLLIYLFIYLSIYLCNGMILVVMPRITKCK